MDLVQLRRFLVAAEAGNLRRAAARLHVSQPALTQSIKGLELRLGVDLFDRSARGVTLTRFGTALVPRARMMLNERERIARDLEEIRSERSARISVGVGPYFIHQLFPSAVLRTLERFPTAKISVTVGQTVQLMNRLQEGILDCAFCVHNPAIDTDPGLEFADTHEERYSVMARSGHPLSRRKRVTDKDVSDCTWIVYDADGGPDYLTRSFAERGIPVPRWAIATASLPLMTSLISKSDLVGIMPDIYVRSEIAAGRLVRLVGHSLEVRGRGGILTRKSRVHGPTTRELIVNLRGVCAEAQAQAQKPAGHARPAAHTITAMRQEVTSP